MLAVALGALLPGRAIAGPESGVACVEASEQGHAARARGALVLARQRFIACAADACGKSLRADCGRWLDDVEASIPTVVLGAKDAHGVDVFDVRVSVDGVPVTGHDEGTALRMDPGQHAVRFERPGGEHVALRILLRAGEKNRPVLATFAPPAPLVPPPIVHDERRHSIPTATWIFGGVGLAALGSFAFFAATGLAEKDRLRETCSPRCNDDHLAGLRTRYVAADVSLAVSVVALGLATYFFVRD